MLLYDSEAGGLIIREIRPVVCDIRGFGKPMPALVEIENKFQNYLFGNYSCKWAGSSFMLDVKRSRDAARLTGDSRGEDRNA
ncbi:protein of unknown function [Paraburkholderia dioscoreae]|uniref:Uncharacterized protein n=1 Tax=Paraburkholderia dioscoreae TaxID=2604047 RepID=A0A5Q4ZPD1_9BURK|nr:protein of unknown function [Paraburkholderia dioscoreae]